MVCMNWKIQMDASAQNKNRRHILDTMCTILQREEVLGGYTRRDWIQ